MIGVRVDGSKELVALTDGYREATESWADCCATADGAACAPRSSRSGRRAGVLGRATRGVPTDPRAALLVPQDRQRARGAAKRRTRARRRRWPRSGTPRTRTTPAPRRRPSRSPTARSSARPSRRSPTTSRSCSPSTTTRPNTGCICAPRTRSSHLRDRAAPQEDHQGTRLEGGRTGDGLQADRGRPGPLARRERTPPRRPGPRRRHASRPASSSNDPTHTPPRDHQDSDKDLITGIDNAR